jgi:LPS sulfotransferase NodH
MNTKDHTGPRSPDRSRPSAIFIAGLGHSGSTVLELLLSGSEQVVGLGEVHNYLRRSHSERQSHQQPPCTCGHALADCELWGPIKERCEEPEHSLADKYRLVLRRAQELYGNDVTIIDSSKNLDGLRHLAGATGNVVVVHMIRDVRSWTISRINRAARRGQLDLFDLIRQHGARGLSRRLKMTAWYRFKLWHELNQRIAAGLLETGLPVVRLGYEPLASGPRAALERLCQRIGLEFDERMLVPAKSTAHIVGGNFMRFLPTKTQAVMYPTQWLTRTEWLLPSMVRRRTMRANSEWVYGDWELPVDRYPAKPVPPHPKIEHP